MITLDKFVLICVSIVKGESYVVIFDYCFKFQAYKAFYIYFPFMFIKKNKADLFVIQIYVFNEVLTVLELLTLTYVSGFKEILCC